MEKEIEEREWEQFLENVSGDVSRLDHVYRYSSIPVISRENVSTHSFWVCLYSVMIHRTISKGKRDWESIERKIMLKAISHDISECLTGDIVRVFKYSSTEFKNQVDEAEKKISDKLPSIIKEIMEIEDNQKNMKYIEQIVKAADFLSLYMFLKREKDFGSSVICPYIDRMKKDLEKMESALSKGEWYEIELSTLYKKMVSMSDEQIIGEISV